MIFQRKRGDETVACQNEMLGEDSRRQICGRTNPLRNLTRNWFELSIVHWGNVACESEWGDRFRRVIYHSPLSITGELPS